MTMPEEFTVPEAAAYLSVSEETVRRNIRSRRLKAPTQRYAVVHPTGCPCHLRRQLRSEDWQDSANAVGTWRNVG